MLVPAAEYRNPQGMPLLARHQTPAELLSSIFRRSKQRAASAGTDGAAHRRLTPVAPSAQPRAMQQRSWFSIQPGAALGRMSAPGQKRR